MKLFKETKVIKAQPMNRKDYNDFKGWEVPSDENPSDEGYLVGYPNAKGNFDGPELYGCHHLSWSPKDVFEASYKEKVELSIHDEKVKQNPIIAFFKYEHLPPHLKEVSRAIGDVALQMLKDLPDNAETSAGLRKLLEAKDCFVRSKLLKSTGV